MDIGQIIIFTVVGFIAQIIDGTLGMAYGVIAMTFLLGFGIPPAVASAAVHAAEIFTTGVSSVSHYRFGNVEKYLIKKLVVPGVIGAVLGAYILTAIPGEKIRPMVAIYLLIMGGVILSRAFRKVSTKQVRSYVAPLGLSGGFLDAIGGGGWGPVVASTLVARGNDPRFSIGSTNFAEFFVALSASMTFLLTIGLGYWEPIIGLAIGGAIAAPLAAFMCTRVRPQLLMAGVGLIIVMLSVRTMVTDQQALAANFTYLVGMVDRAILFYQ